MRREARVERIENGRVWVSAETEQGCGRCQEPGGCKSGLMSKPLSARCNTYLIESNADLSVGQRVELELPERAVLEAALFAYGLPLVLMLVFGATAALLLAHDGWVAVSALCGLGLAWLIVPRASNREKMRAMRVGLIKTLDS